MKILVTGGAGFIGSELIRKLVDRNENCTIVSLDNYMSGFKKNHIDHSNVKYLEGNTWDADKIFSNDKFDVVFHFGEYSRIYKSFENIKLLYESILRGTPVILELVRKWNAKLIYSATSSGLNNKQDLSPYSWMKNKMCELVKNYSKWYGIRYQISYFFNVYGGNNEINDGDFSTVIAIFKKKYLNNEKLTVVKPGTQERFFTNVDDVTDGLLKILNHQSVNNEWYLCNENSYSILDIVKMFNTDFVYIDERKGERFIAFKKDNDTKEKLNWEANKSLKDYINTIKKSK